MNRRSFMVDCAAVILGGSGLKGWGAGFSASDVQDNSTYDSLVGKEVDLAGLGEMQSWNNPEATQFIQKLVAAGGAARGTLNLLGLPRKGEQSDVGVEWPEFRTINKVVIRFAAEDKMPADAFGSLEYWSGISARQGAWTTMQDGDSPYGLPPRRNGRTWEYLFQPLRTCKVRFLLQDQAVAEVEGLEIYGSSRWKAGEVYIEWGHDLKEQSSGARLEIYNGQILKVEAAGNTEMSGPLEWHSVAGSGKLSGIVARVLYTSGMDVDRTILTVRSEGGDYSFLPGEILEDQPITIPDFGVYVRNNALNLDAAEFVRQNAGRRRIHDAVARLPEQTLDNAGKHIHVPRVYLSFIGVDSNNHKFGIAPDGHLLVANGDPAFGKPMNPQFGVFFESTQTPILFQKPTPAEIDRLRPLFQEKSKEKRQELEEGWLPIIITNWSDNDLTFERTDYAVLHDMPEELDESTLRGDELALMVSRLKIKNDSPIPKIAEYYVKPWRSDTGDVYSGNPAGLRSRWEPVLHEDIVGVIDQDSESVICHVDTHGEGALSLNSTVGFVTFSTVLKPGAEIGLDLVIPGAPLPTADAAKLRGLDYDRLHQATVSYWKKLLAAGMTVEVPDSHMQNLFNANLHHFLLALTKDAKRGEYYANSSMLGYGPIGSESSPIMQSMDMRGIHDRVKNCLRAWLSTQGSCKPNGDYASKEGGFYYFDWGYTSDQYGVLWALAEHYLYTRDKEWLTAVAPQIVDGCDFILRERRRIMKRETGETKPLYYGLAPAGCLADSGDWEYSFMLNGYFSLALKKCAGVLEDVDAVNAARIRTETEEYLQAIRRILKECIAISPVTRLRDNTGVPVVPSYVGLRGLSTDVKDSVDPDPRHAYAYDSTIGPFHLVKAEVLEPNSREAEWMLNYLEDRLFMFSPLPSRVDLSQLSTDWFNLGGFEKLQPYYVHYQDAYLRRDEIPNFLRGFFNTLLAISDPMTFTFIEELDDGGGQANKTHEEGWFFQQFRCMLVMEMESELFLARGTPREWLQHGKRIAVNHAPTYFGELTYSIESREKEGRIEAKVAPPVRKQPTALYLRLRHPEKARMKHVTINGRSWTRFNPDKEWIEIPINGSEVTVVASY